MNFAHFNLFEKWQRYLQGIWLKDSVTSFHAKKL